MIYYLMKKHSHEFEETYKYKIPKNLNKDIYIPQRRASNRIVIVEGIFDMTAIWKYTTYDVLPLFGLFVMDYATEMLKRAGYEIVYLCLDGEASKECLFICQRLQRASVNTYYVPLPDKCDPDNVGDKINMYIDKAQPYSLSLAVKVRIGRL